MKDIVVHLSGREIDLSAPTPDDERLLREIYETRERSLRCHAHGGGVYLWMRKLDRTMWASHMPGAPGAGSKHAIALMSTEHKRQIDYVVRAAEHAGLPAVSDRELPGSRRRPDVVVNGDTGLEVQRSGITHTRIKTRTTQAIRDGGLRSMTWLSDASQAPGWMGIVPSARFFFRDWLQLPREGEAKIVGGLVRLGRKLCTERNTLVCPERGHGRPCGKWHVSRDPMGGFTLDEMTVGMAVGQFTAVQIRGYAYLALTDEADHLEVPRWGPPPKKQRTMRPARRAECQAERPEADPTPVCCGDRWPAGSQLFLGCQLCPNSPTYWRNAR